MVRHCVPFGKVIFKWRQVKTQLKFTCPLRNWIFFPALKLFFDQFFLRIYCREFKAKGLKFKVAQDFLLEVNLDSF